MNRSQLLELLLNGESSGLEFKRDDIRPQRLAGEIVALLNLEGGHILLGVEDDATASGLTREPKEAEEWVMQIARDHVQPAVIPYWETLEWDDGVVIGVVSLPADAPDKPYKVKSGASWVTRIRVGTTTRDATRERGRTTLPTVWSVEVRPKASTRNNTTGFRCSTPPGLFRSSARREQFSR